jgi:hypothetical protein
MTVNSGIDAGREVLMRHSSVVDTVHQEMMSTDAAAAQSFGL